MNWHPPRALPLLDPDTTPFWTGGADGQLLIQRCRACDRFFHPPSPACPRCGTGEVGPEPVSGRATVAAVTVNHQPWAPGFDPPYAYAIVELQEDPSVRLSTNVIGCAPDEVAIGMAVEATFDQYEDVWIPLFRPA